jgi:hypothetical protein
VAHPESFIRKDLGMNQLVAHQYRTGADRLALLPGVQQRR